MCIRELPAAANRLAQNNLHHTSLALPVLRLVDLFIDFALLIQFQCIE